MPVKLLLILIIPLLTTTGQLLLKKGAFGLGDLELSFLNIFRLIPKILQSGWLMAGLLVFGLVFVLYPFVLSKFQLNILYPILVSIGITMISLASWALLKESLSLLQISGIIIIIFGIFLLMPR